jgi:hypothetical protein
MDEEVEVAALEAEADEKEGKNEKILKLPLLIYYVRNLMKSTANVIKKTTEGSVIARNHQNEKIPLRHRKVYMDDKIVVETGHSYLLFLSPILDQLSFGTGELSLNFAKYCKIQLALSLALFTGFCSGCVVGGCAVGGARAGGDRVTTCRLRDIRCWWPQCRNMSYLSVQVRNLSVQFIDLPLKPSSGGRHSRLIPSPLRVYRPPRTLSLLLNAHGDRVIHSDEAYVIVQVRTAR